MGAIRSSAQLGRNGRLGMSAIVASTSTLIALLSHVLAGGPVPELQGVLVPLALAIIVCLPLSGRLHSLPRLVPAVVLSQLLYHWLFVLGASGTGVLVAAEGIAGLTGHEGHAFVLLGGAAAAASADALMWAAHGIAAVITVVLIRRGESAVLGLQRLVELIARAILPALPIHTSRGITRRTVVADVASGSPTVRLLAGIVTRRGPPQVAALAFS